jgi:DNA-binding transcriptional LysR family regulator
MHVGDRGCRGADEVLNVGKSAYTDPYLITTLLSIRLPLFPGLRIKLWSNYSHELMCQVISGKLDMALITAVPDAPALSLLTVADSSLYAVMSMSDPWLVIKRFDCMI